MNQLGLHFEAAIGAWKNLFKQPIGTVLVLLMLAVAMALPMALYIGVKSSGQIWGRLNENPQITLYLARDADQAAIDRIRAAAQSDNRVEKVEFISRQEGMRQLQEAFVGQDLVSMLDENPLPDVLVIHPHNGTSPDAQQALLGKLATVTGVESAETDSEWLKTLYQINQMAKQVLRFLAFTLAAAFVLVAHNTIRLQILSHKEEIEITQLLGAPASFIRRPFVYQAVWQGALSAGLSLLLCAWLIERTRPIVAQIFTPYGLHLDWHFFSAGEMAVIFALVCGLAAMGAWWASSRHLREFRTRHA